ncbi:D-alanine--D-alanine ligase [Limnobacter sp.]|uniref:D-alanine--D-alanine ligase n=1 Tax=Limnobacter sp. TaxID=2003368 RepID=UPI0025889B39|nr:D-alanine--D-alanine ligase [Limnobacter sp.]
MKVTAESLGKVVVLFGGKSAEREVSLKSGSMVLAALKRQGVDAHAFDPAEQSLVELAQGKFDRAVISLHGRFGEDGTIQGALEYLGIPYTGSGVMASAVAMDKIMTKAVWSAEGLATPDHVRLQPGFDEAAVIHRLGLPLIVKPAQEGSTLGLTKVKSAADLKAAFELAYRYDPNVLAEKFVKGQELTVPLMGEGEQAIALPVIRIQAPDGNYDYHNKYVGNDTQYFCPSGLDPAFEREVQALCLKAYRSLGCAGWGRADVLVDESGKPWLLEMNTSPGMTDHSLVPMSARASGIEYDDLVMRIAASAALKGNGQRADGKV